MKNLLLIFLLFSTSAFSQVQHSLKGIITNENGIPLKGVSVLVPQPEYIAVTDEKGKFTLNGLPPYSFQIHISHLGYDCIDKTLQISEDTLINFSMYPAAVQLKDIIITDRSAERRKREQSFDVEIVSKEFILRNAQSSLMKSLEKISGVTSIEIGQGFSKPVVRGLSFNRVAVVENGIKQQGQQWGADHGLEIDQYNISGVEVIKGPASLLFGSDAIGGVIVLAQPRLSLHDGFEAGLILLTKSVNNHFGGSLNTGFQKKGKYIKARLTFQDYGDYAIPADTFNYLNYRFPIYNRILKNTSGEEQNLNISAGWVTSRIVSNLTISNVHSKMGFFAGAHGIPSLLKLSDDGDRRNIELPYQQVNHFKIISNTQFRQGSAHLVSINAGYQINRRKEFSSPHSHGYEPVPEGNLELDFKLQTASLNVDHQIKNTQNNTFNFGINTEYQNNSIGGYSFLLPAFSQGTAGLYFFDKYQVSDKLMANAGLRYDFGLMSISQFIDPYISIYLSDSILAAKYKVRSPALKRMLNDYSFAIGAVYSVSPKSDIKLNAGKSFRMPTANEFSSNGIHHGTFRHEMGDSTLHSENSYQLDADIDYRSEIFKVNGGGFMNYFPDFIFLNPSGEFSFLPDAGQIYKYVQSKAFRVGGELQIEYRPVKSLKISTVGEVVFATDLETGYPIPFTPPLNVISEAEYDFNDYKFLRNSAISFSWKWVSAQNRVARNELATDGYNVFSIAIWSDVSLGNTTLRFSGRIDNLLNAKYYNHLSFYRPLDIPEAGRNFQLSLSIPFLKQK